MQRITKKQEELKKSPEEKQLLKELKKAHKAKIKSSGVDHKKQMNNTKPVFVSWKALDK